MNQTPHADITDIAVPPPSFEDLAADRHYHHLVDKGYTPHQKEVSVPIGMQSEIWWDRGNQFTWPMAAGLIGLMAFLVLMVKGVPW